MAWAADNKTLFLTTEDDVTKRSDKLFRHVLGSPTFDLLYDEKDELYDIEVGKTRDQQVSRAGNRFQGHQRMPLPVAPTRPQDNFAVFLPREKKHRYYIDHREGLFYIRTNQSGINFAIMTAPESDTARKNWKIFLAHRDDVLHRRYRSVQGFRRLGRKVAGPRAPARPQFQDRNLDRHRLPRARVFRLSRRHAGLRIHHLPLQLPEPDHTPERLRLRYPRAENRTLLKQQEVLGGYDPTQYASERLWATARDGIKVPSPSSTRRAFGARRQGAALPLRLRLLRNRHAAGVFQHIG